MRAPVIEYVTEEVSRQGHDITSLDGIERVAWMLHAWEYALRQSVSQEFPTIAVVQELGMMIEPMKNQGGWRRVNVRVGSRKCPHPDHVFILLADLFGLAYNSMRPLDFYREFELVHPFVDGNGRTGKILLNWVNGTLLNPIFPPEDFWGMPIRNP